MVLISYRKTICQCNVAGCDFIRYSAVNALIRTQKSVLQIIFEE